MASVVINGDTSGAITVAAPAVAGTNTLTLPSETGTVLTSVSTTVYPKGGPAFSAYRSTDQTGVTSSTETKVQLATENFDTNSNFDSSTNYRFTPTVAGYYQFCWSIRMTGTGLNNVYSILFRNGGGVAWGTYASGTIGTVVTAGSTILYANGSSDYFELYGYGAVTSGSVTFTGNTAFTNLSGCLLRAA